jgi:hypothetical protein
MHSLDVASREALVDARLINRLLCRNQQCLGFLFFLFSRWRWSSPNATYLKYYREQLGGDGPFLCEVEITPAGLTIRQIGIETKRPWSVVEEIVDTSDGLEFRCRIGGILVVRDRAFETAELRSVFLRRAKEFLASSAAGSPDQQRTA